MPKNGIYYQYYPPLVTQETVGADWNALPPGKKPTDQYYPGFYDGGHMIAVLDLILAYSNGGTAFIGTFMTDQSIQGMGIGGGVKNELCAALKDMGFSAVRLGWVLGNPRAQHFWHKNDFRETEIPHPTEGYAVVVAQRDLCLVRPKL